VSATGGRRADILGVLRDADAPLSIAAIAERLYVHANTVRFHLDALLATGQVERVAVAPDKPGRPPQLFAATSGMDPGGPRHYRLLAEALTEAVAGGVDPVRNSRAAGRALGVRIAKHRRADARSEPVGALVELLAELGFAPERMPGGTRIGLRHCPFLEVAKAHPEVVCPVHLGLMQGAMASWRAPTSVATLTPFVEPGLCVAQLAGARS
jgi:predicted ArsR family transcriptional regulator